MNITLLLASNSDVVGGMEKQVALQANALAGYPDISIHVIAHPDLQHLFDERVLFNPVSMQKSRRNPFFLNKIRNAIQTHKPDIIHAHGHKASTILASLKTLFRLKTKCIATSHGTKKNNTALKKMDAVIAISKTMQDHLYPISSSYIPNGIVLAPHQAHPSREEFIQALGLNKNMPIVIAVGRLAKVKRYDLLIQACKDLPINTVIIGDGPEMMALKSIATQNIFFTGHRDDIPAIMKLADVLVISSEREGFSLTLIEALLAELAIVSTKVSGSVDILPTEQLISEASPQVLRAKIQETLHNHTQVKQLLKPAFRFAKGELTIQACVEKTHKLYQTVVNPNA